MEHVETAEKVDTPIKSPVRVSIPASVAADLGRLKKAFGNVLGQLGCPSCCSGRDIFWEIQQDFAFQKTLKEEPLSSRSFADRGAINTVQVTLSPHLGGDLNNVFDALEKIAALTGHVACATGCDMHFKNQIRLLLDEKLNVHERVLEVRR